MSRDYFSNIIEPRNFLNLDGINVKQIRDVVGKYVIEADLVDHPIFCQKCSARIIKHGVREQTYRDLLMHGRKVEIALSIQR